jgi:hypothetical protein
MEVLRFYSWAPNPRYDVWIQAIRQELCTIPVLTDNSKARRRNQPGLPVPSTTYNFPKVTSPVYQQHFADMAD